MKHPLSHNTGTSIKKHMIRMDSMRNHFFYTHFPRFTLILPIHFSPFDPPIDKEINDTLYAGKLKDPDPIIEVQEWEKWWHENRDKPFHLAYIHFKGDGKDE